MNVRIPEFISKVRVGDFEAGYEVVAGTNSLDVYKRQRQPHRRLPQHLHRVLPHRLGALLRVHDKLRR